MSFMIWELKVLKFFMKTVQFEYWFTSSFLVTVSFLTESLLTESRLTLSDSSLGVFWKLIGCVRFIVVIVLTFIKIYIILKIVNILLDLNRIPLPKKFLKDAFLNQVCIKFLKEESKAKIYIYIIKPIVLKKKNYSSQIFWKKTEKDRARWDFWIVLREFTRSFSMYITLLFGR